MSAPGTGEAWTWRHAIVKSDLPATTRHVLLTLSIYMNEAGKGCFPSVDEIVSATGLSKRAVLTHLQAAVDAGWLVRRELGLRGRKWRRSEYESRWPDRGGAMVDEDQDEDEGGERGAPPHADEVVNDVHHLADQGGERAAPEVVNVVHHYRRPVQLPVQREREGARARATDRDREGPGGEEAGPADGELSNRPETSSDGDAASTGRRSADDGGPDPSRSRSDDRSSPLSSDGQSVLDMIALYPHGRQYPRGQVETAWAALTPDERQRAIAELPGWLDERKAAKLGRMFLQTYLAERQFDLPKSAGMSARPTKGGKGEKGRKGVTFVGENPSFRHWSAAWFAHLIWRVSNGKSIGLALQQARANPASGWGCPKAELPDLSVLDHVVHVSSRSDEWRAWCKWFEDRDPTAHWPSFDREMWFDLPSHWPPGSETGPSEGQGIPSEDPDEFPIEVRI